MRSMLYVRVVIIKLIAGKTPFKAAVTSSVGKLFGEPSMSLLSDKYRENL
jgi:hypothetical protein